MPPAYIAGIGSLRNPARCRRAGEQERERERARVWGWWRSEGENGEGEKEREVVVGVRTTRTVWCWCGATLCLQRTNNVAKGHRRDERGSKQRDVTRAEVRHCRYHARRPINDGVRCSLFRLCLHLSKFSFLLLFFVYCVCTRTRYLQGLGTSYSYCKQICTAAPSSARASSVSLSELLVRPQ